ncbi:MFS transporter [Verminephrobacter eiseniae]|uniref:MFS transporter n=1 Tax=Verminephrobacter eiseniae TaxID=364317 RepID=UPI0022372DAA|nr:MFS transporter [Verminephrobacter eiseniae]MCW5262198.1 MFS transporter [Verminephrobacter eiseniae]MCW5294369.1 MFS transporter [Verminephrobacter eiseniae]MCW8186415.1 MFS transporter [Verminephrobacter eiseniae]MCW8224862.1 MFS transporter [Verminephrobacter eiseniae]MCW8235887.1 MFS transporter [Verminephrobacter eiseniae]
MSTAQTIAPSVPADPATLRRAMTAGVIGHFVEWYDYGVYAYVATILAVVFFAPSDPTAALLSVFATFAVAFFARPLGGLIFGYLGDRIGRQRCLAFVIVLMSVATFTIGILPTYEQVSVLAPVLLLICRIVQGLSAGGEIAGASSFINEYAPQGRRGLFSSLLPAASAVGLLFGALLMAILTANLSTQQMIAWGWRVPFLIALLLGAAGLYLRIKIEDTPMFRALVSAAKTEANPLKASIMQQSRWIAVAFGATLTYGVGFYTILSYMPSYLRLVSKLDQTSVFAITAVTLIAHIIALPMWGALSDRVGRRPVILGASLALMVVTYPAFLLLAQGNTPITGMIGGAFMAILIAAGAAPLFAYMAEMFPTTVRASSISIGYNASVMLFGGTAPFIATYLIQSTGSQVAPSFYLVAAAACATLTLLFAGTNDKSHRIELRQS